MLTLEICFNKYYRVSVLILVVINVFHFIITFFKNYSDICETKANVVPIVVVLLVGVGLCIYQTDTENKVGQYNEIKGQSISEREYNKDFFER